MNVIKNEKVKIGLSLVIFAVYTFMGIQSVKESGRGWLTDMGNLYFIGVMGILFLSVTLITMNQINSYFINKNKDDVYKKNYIYNDVFLKPTINSLFIPCLILLHFIIVQNEYHSYENIISTVIWSFVLLVIAVVTMIAINIIMYITSNLFGIPFFARKLLLIGYVLYIAYSNDERVWLPLSNMKDVFLEVYIGYDVIFKNQSEQILIEFLTMIVLVIISVGLLKYYKGMFNR